MAEKSAGILLYLRSESGLEVWIAHMGGPFWAGRDAAAWSIPKGLYDDAEEPLVAALREFEGEMGLPAPAVDYELLGEFRQPSGKVVTVTRSRRGYAPSRGAQLPSAALTPRAPVCALQCARSSSRNRR